MEISLFLQRLVFSEDPEKKEHENCLLLRNDEVMEQGSAKCYILFCLEIKSYE
jgi:hypothetical protein